MTLTKLPPVRHPDRCQTFDVWFSDHFKDLLLLYQYLHKNPELSGQEGNTAARVAREFQADRFDVTMGIGGYGVVATLTNGRGPVLMLRAELDALPIAEQTGLSFASKAQSKDAQGNLVGVMHACGHDLHLTNLIGVGRYLADHQDQWQGSLLLVAQPAEETLSGAEAMLRDGIFEKFPKPDFAIALHCDARLASGQVGLRAEYLTSNVDSIDITIHGRGGHGAYPHTTIDPIVIASRLVLDLQTIVSREIDPFEPAVVTVGSIRAGNTHNVISSACELKLTLRSSCDAVRQKLIESVTRMAEAATAAAGAPLPAVKVCPGTAAVYNNIDLTAAVQRSLYRAIGESNVVDTKRTMGAEDFACFGREGVPICMLRLGSADAQRLADFEQLQQVPPLLHSPSFYPDAEKTLRTGITGMATIALDILNRK